MSATFKEVLTSFRKDIKNTFQAQKNIVDVTERYLNQLENAYEGGGSGGGSLDYSTTEEIERGTWIDGKKYYSKCFSNLTIPSGGYSTEVNLGVEADTIINVTPVGTATANNDSIIGSIYSKVVYSSGNNTLIYPSSLIGAAYTNANIEVLYTKK